MLRNKNEAIVTKIATTMLVLSVVLLGVSIAPAAVLVGHWTFDSDLTDSVGGNHGVALGNAAAGASGAQVGSGAATFDGAGDAIRIVDSVIPDGTFSIAFWEKSVAGTEGYLIGAGAGVGFEDIFLRWLGGGGNGFNVGGANGGFWSRETSSETREQWYHHAITQNSTGDLAYYINGELAIFTATTETLDNPVTGTKFPATGLGDDLYIGNRKDLERSYGGLIDDLRIYDDALTQEQIQTLIIPEPISLPLLLTSIIGTRAVAGRRK